MFWRVGKLGLGSFCGVPVSESKPHQRLDILEHFMKSSMALFGPLSGVLFLGALLRTKDPIFHGAFVACLHRYAFVNMSLR